MGTKKNDKAKPAEKSAPAARSEAKKAAEKSAVVAEAPPKAVAAANDSIAINRALPVIDASQVPDVPAGFRVSDPDIKRTRLRRVGKEVQAELRQALREAAALGPALTETLGKYAPAATRADELLQQVNAVTATRLKALALVEYLDEIQEIRWSDAQLYLDEVKKEFDHVVSRESHVEGKFPALIAFYKAHSAAISEGIALSKAKRESADNKK